MQTSKGDEVMEEQVSMLEIGSGIIYLTTQDRDRLSKWLAEVSQPCPPDFNWGRFQFLLLGASNYISTKELALLMDCLPPIGYACDIIRGEVEVRRIS